jgi:DNA helicase-2/ATP-dependent DNA helicase PcrA
MSILYRNNFISRGFEEALMRLRAPYVLVGDVGFYARAEIKDALAFLRLAESPDDRQSDEECRRVINEPRRGFGAKALQILEAEASMRGLSLLKALETVVLPQKTQAAGLAFAAQIRRVAADPSHTVADQISLLLDAAGYRAMLRESKAETTEDRLENLQELIELAGGFHTVRELLDHTALATNRPDEDDTKVVRLMTLHKAKGLEFRHVFLPAWESGVVPSDFGDRDEERRLAYVALTRGMNRITISHCGFRRGPAAPSPFLDDIPEATRVKGWLRDQGRPRAPFDSQTPINPRSLQARVRRF